MVTPSNISVSRDYLGPITDEKNNEIINCLLENGRQSLILYEEYIPPRIFKELITDSAHIQNRLITLLKIYCEKLWESEYGRSNKWFISFLEHYKTEYTDT